MLWSAYVHRCRLTAAAVRLSYLPSPLQSSRLVVQPGSSSLSLLVRTLKTFIPFAGSTPEEGVMRSLIALDDKRLGKQRVESRHR